MPYWRLNEVQKAVLLDFVKGETVWELGCGDLSLASLMAQTAQWVHAADKEKPSVRPDHGRQIETPSLPNLSFYPQTFKQLRWPEHLDTVVTCWPVTHKVPGFMEIVQRAFRVVYIGCNTGGSACGEHALWLHLTKRMLVHEVPDQRNCLHCYSLVTHKDPQFRSEEEVLGLLNEAGRFRIFNYGRMMVDELKEAKVVEEVCP